MRDCGDITQVLADVERGDVAARLVNGAVGSREGGGSPDETAWAFRRLFETLAATHPLVVVVDDIHWADPTLLDLIEYLTASSTGVGIFVLCTARPDIFGVRPTWATPRVGATLVMLEPLEEDDSSRLVDVLAHELVPALRERVVATAEGNPLFVEQLLAHFAHDANAQDVPPTIQALLAARIDRLEPEERAVIQHGSVEGRLFHRGAVRELLDDGSDSGVSGTLVALVRKEFVRHDRSLFPGDDAFRFNHVLIRDVAYASMPKELRSRLHVRLADWLEAQGTGVGGDDEIVGYHVEQAYRLSLDLGRRNDELALRAGRLLGRAGEAALDRGEPTSAVSLLSRAEALLTHAPAERVKLLPDLARALQDRGSLQAAEELFGDAIRLSGEVGDQHAELRGEVGLGRLSLMLGTADAGKLRVVAERAIAAFDDDADLADAWQLVATAHLRGRDRTAQLDALLRAREHAIASGDLRRQIDAWNEVGGAMIFGRTPLAECKEFIDAELAWAEEHGLPAVEADALLAGPYLHARRGDFELARKMLHRSKAIYRELGFAYGLAEAGMAGSELETLAGDLVAAERELREAMSVAAEMGAAHYVALYQVRLARILNEQGRHDEAAALLASAAGLYGAAPSWKSNQARVLAARADLDQAVALADEAVAQEGGSDDITAVAQTLVDVSHVFRAAGDRERADAVLVEAIALNEEKGNVVAAQQARERLASLG